MVKFVHSVSKTPEVEEVMRIINNYINYNDENLIGASLDYIDLNQELELFQELLRDVNDKYEISAYTPISSQGRFQRIKCFLKKIFRKLLGWYVKDVCRQQTEFNACAVRAMNQQNCLMQAVVKENEMLKRQYVKITKNMSEE